MTTFILFGGVGVARVSGSRFRLGGSWGAIIYTYYIYIYLFIYLHLYLYFYLYLDMYNIYICMYVCILHI